MPSVPFSLHMMRFRAWPGPVFSTSMRVSFPNFPLPNLFAIPFTASMQNGKRPASHPFFYPSP